MPEWKKIVRRHLCVLRACSPERAALIREELAGHLEDRYEDLLQSGVSKDAAKRGALADIEQSRSVWLNLRLLKEAHMSNFTNRVGLPGLITFGLSLALAWALEIVHVQPKIIWLSNGLFLALPFAWMCLLPICGAVGATISRRRGGSYLDRMAAAASPAIIFAVALLFISIAGFVISIFVPGYEWNWKVVAWGLGVWGLGYAVLPSLALMIGVIAASLVEDQRAAA